MRATISELRAEYLYPLAHLCHVSPTENLKVADMFILIAGIDEYIAEQKRQQNG